MNNTSWRLAIAVDGDGSMIGAAQAAGKRPRAVAGTSASAVATAAARRHGRSVPQEIILVHPGWMSLDEVGEQVGIMVDAGVGTARIRTRPDTSVIAEIAAEAAEAAEVAGVIHGDVVVVDAMAGRVATATAAGPVDEEAAVGVAGHGGDPVVEMVRGRMRDSGAFTTRVVLVGRREQTVGMERRLGDVVSGPVHLEPGDLAIGALDPSAVRAAVRFEESGPGESSGRGRGRWRVAGAAAVVLAIVGGMWTAENYDEWTGAAETPDAVADAYPQAAPGQGGGVAPPEREQLPAAPSRPDDGTSVPDMMAHYFTAFDPRPLLLPADDCNANDARLAENIHLHCTGMSGEWASVAAAIPGLVFTENGIPAVSVDFESKSALGFSSEQCGVRKDRDLPAAEGFRLIVAEPCDSDGNVYPLGEWPEGKISELQVVHLAGAVVDGEGQIMYPSLTVGSLASSGSAQAIIDYFGIGA